MSITARENFVAFISKTCWNSLPDKRNMPCEEYEAYRKYVDGMLYEKNALPKVKVKQEAKPQKKFK